MVTPHNPGFVWEKTSSVLIITLLSASWLKYLQGRKRGGSERRLTSCFWIRCWLRGWINIFLGWTLLGRHDKVRRQVAKETLLEVVEVEGDKVEVMR